MNISAVGTAALAWTGDALALGVSSQLLNDEQQPLGLLAELDQRFGGLVRDLIAESDFKAKPGSSASIRIGGEVKQLILVGLGTAEDVTAESLRQAAAAALKSAQSLKAHKLGLVLPLVGDAAGTVQAAAEALLLTNHRDLRFKSEPEDKRTVEAVELLDLAAGAAGIARAESVAAGVKLARELVTAPANVVDPISMAETAEAIAAETGLELTILEEADCDRLGMGAFLGVAKASDLPPKFIHLTYRPAGTPRRRLAVVGKGLTFDSGGYNIKGVGSGIETMKMDMGGAAATLGAAKAIGLLKPDVEVHFISAVTENMISGKGMHPGDVLTASNGKTIEVNNTDAEGRLTLADALVYADKLGCDAIVDLATLTGACIIALGNDIAGLWSTSDELAEQLKAAAKVSGEKVWQLPMEESYFEGLKSPIADMKNTGPRGGGSITAALFLKQFVKDTAAWAHLDVAGPVWADKDKGYNPAGATGYGVRTLVSWITG